MGFSGESQEDQIEKARSPVYFYLQFAKIGRAHV